MSFNVVFWIFSIVAFFLFLFMIWDAVRYPENKNDES